MEVHFKINSIDVRMFVFELITVDGIKPGIIVRNDLGYLIDSSERSRNHNVAGSLDIISQIRNCTRKDLWFT